MMHCNILLLAISLATVCQPAILSSNLNYQQYSPEMSYLSLILSSAAYAPDCNGCYINSGKQGRFGQLTNVTQTTVPQATNQVLTWSGFVARMPARSLTAVVYRGTSGTKQLIDEILSVLAKQPVKSPIGVGRVQAYFSSAQAALWRALEPAYRALRTAYPDDAVLVTGHSLGAAMAALGAARIMHDKGLAPAVNRLALYTFGEPRVGDGDFARAFNELVPNSWRVVHGWDPVVHLPPCQMLNDQCDAGSASDPYHHGTEVYFRHDMPMLPQTTSYRLCLGEPPGEDRSCSDGHYATQTCLLDVSDCLDDHLNYFGIVASKWWQVNRCRGNQWITDSQKL